MATTVLETVAALTLSNIVPYMHPSLAIRPPHHETYLDIVALRRTAAHIPGTSVFVQPPAPPPPPPPHRITSSVTPASHAGPAVARVSNPSISSVAQHGGMDTISRFVSNRVFGSTVGATLPQRGYTAGSRDDGGDISTANRASGVKRDRDMLDDDVDSACPPAAAVKYGDFRTGRDLAIANGNRSLAGNLPSDAAAAPPPAASAPKRRMGVGLQRPAPAAAPSGVAAPYKNPIPGGSTRAPSAGSGGAGSSSAGAGAPNSASFRGGGTAGGGSGSSGQRASSSVLDTYGADAIPEQLQVSVTHDVHAH